MSSKKKTSEKAQEASESESKPKVRLAKFMASTAILVLKDSNAEENLPNLYDHMAPIYEGHTLMRCAGTIRISVEGGYYRVSLSCPTEKVETVMVTDSLVGIIDALERYLAMGTQVYKPAWEKTKKALPTIDDLIK